MDFLQNIPRNSELSGHLLRLPNTDRGTLAGLDSISDIRAWTNSKGDEYRRLAFALLAIHNFAAPIHRLPTEVLAQILERCWHDRKSVLLPHVCRLWRSILLDGTAFWADAVADCELRGKQVDLHDDSDLPFINALLARSTQHSRNIKPSFFGFTHPIVESLTPYKSNVVSLKVTVCEDDLNRLWPLLVSGMLNLRNLVIHLMITKAMEGFYSDDRSLDWLFDDEYTNPWMGFDILSREDLPQLSCLTCPPNLHQCFGDVMLRQLKVEWWDQSLCRLQFPTTNLGLLGPGCINLEPYRDSLETLEILPLSLDYSDIPDTLHFPSLRYLHLWPSTSHWLAEGYHIQCFAGDLERLRMDDYGVTAQGLLAVFGSGNAHVTHLTLSPESGDLTIDLHAFPHLERLAVSVEDIDAVISMLQPEGQASALQSLCPSLAELVVTWGLAVNSTRASAAEDKWRLPARDQTEVPTWTSRLTSFVLCIRPAPKSASNDSEGGHNDSESQPNDSMDDGAAESDSTVWPSHAVRQSVLQSFRELVDGPLILKLIDRVGKDIRVDEA